MTNSKKTTTNKTYKQRDTEDTKGKKAFRLRELEEKEDMQQMREYFQSRCSCLDAAYERHAMEQGLVTNPVFEENKNGKS